ncbi:MAG: HDIG domain-containing protein, partial [Lentisphaeria bacterium]|nr:HDIG domain-containing protein [Lentisphaeria bacterium]
VEQPPKYHPEGDVFIHTMLLLEHIAYSNAEVGWSALLHDVGKKHTYSVIDGRIRFFGHEEKGAEMAEKILQRLKLPAKTIKNVVKAIAGHMRFSHVQVMRQSKWRQYLADPNFPLELELHRLDCMACHQMVDNYLVMLDRINELALAGVSPVPKPLITGKDLLKMGLKPSPQLGKILKKIEELQLEGTVSTREEALKKAKEILADAV